MIHLTAMCVKCLLGIGMAYCIVALQQLSTVFLLKNNLLDANLETSRCKNTLNIVFFDFFAFNKQ